MGLVKAGIPLAYIFAETKEEREQFTEEFKSIAEKHKGSINIVTIDAKLYGAHAGEYELIRLFGKRGHGLYNKARGVDHNPVKPTRIRKSVGTERTFSTDMNDDDAILQKIWELSNKTADRLAKIQKSGKTVTVKIKTYKFEALSKQKSLRSPVRNETDIYNIAYSLYAELKDPEVPIRLVGVTVGNLERSTYENMTIYDYI